MINRYYTNKNQSGAVLLVFLGVMVAIMSAVTMLQENFSINNESSYSEVIMTQLKATSESAINLKREKLHNLIINNGVTPNIDFNLAGQNWGLVQCLIRLNASENKIYSGEGILPELNIQFTEKPKTYFTSAVIFSQDGGYKIVACSFNTDDIESSDRMSGHIQKVIPFPADEPTELKSISWQEF